MIERIETPEVNPKKYTGLRVEVKYGDFNKAMTKLKKLIQKDGLMQELRDRQAYEKPSLKRKKARAMAKKRWAKKRKESEFYVPQKRKK